MVFVCAYYYYCYYFPGFQPVIRYSDERGINYNNVTGHSTYILLHNSPISKDLIVHSAYFDDRARNGHNNVTVILIVVNKTILDSTWILGCGASDFEATDFLVYSPHENFDMHAWLGPNPFLYENMIIMCYDLPVVEGINVFVIYRTSNKSDENIYVESEHSLVVPAPRANPTGKHDITVVTCTKAHDKGVTWFPEFIRYQKTIGVDHVHVSILDTFIKDGGLKERLEADPLLLKAINDGYVSISVWKEWYDQDKEVSLHSEILRKLGCMYRFRGTYDYAFPLDTDDFFTPRIPGETKLRYYIKKYCYDKPASTCTFTWITKYPVCGMDGEVGSEGNVTKHLKSQKSQRALLAKSVHSTNASVDVTFHHAICEGCLLPGYKVVKVPEHVAYVAHNRMNKKC